MLNHLLRLHLHLLHHLLGLHSYLLHLRLLLQLLRILRLDNLCWLFLNLLWIHHFALFKVFNANSTSELYLVIIAVFFFTANVEL